MRITVASTCFPFADRGSRTVVDDLVAQLRAREHVVEQTWLPVDPDPSRIVQRDLAVALTDVSDAGELLITVRAPSHLLRHPNKVVWFEPDPLDQPASSDRATSIDQAALADARRVFSTSARAGELLRRIAGIETPILAPERLGSDPDGVLVALLG